MGNLAQIVSAAQENGRRIDMERYSDVAADILNDLHTERLAYNSEYVPLMDAINRLAEYEDTGLEPEEIKEAYRKGWQRAIDEIAYEEQAGTILVENPLLTEYVKLGPTARLRELAQADKEGITPCTFCRFNPPSSCDGKPCSMCPAEAAPKEARND